MKKYFVSMAGVILSEINSIPLESAKVECNESDYIVTNSVIGHHHVISSSSIDVFEKGDDIYINVKETTELRHLRSYNPHPNMNIDVGKYHLIRQEEYTKL